MNLENLRQSRLSYLEQNKFKNLGLLEKRRLISVGRADGLRSLPRKTEDGVYTSPYIEREINYYVEFTYKTYASLQVEIESEFSRLGYLMDSISRASEELEQLRKELEDQRSTTLNKVRKNGESRLTDSQVVSRRLAEKAKLLDPLVKRENELKSLIKDEIDEFMKIRAKIIEDNNSTRLICSRVRERINQRILVYWDAALVKDSKIPVVPTIELKSDAEEVYLGPHKAFLDDVDRFADEIKEKEAA